MTIRFVSGSTLRSIWQPTPQNVHVVFVFTSAALVACRRAGEELLVDRSGRAHGEAAAAELALGVEPGMAVRRHDARLGAAPLEGERGALHDLLRVADAAVAEDAGARVVAHQPVAVLVRLAGRVGKQERRLRVELLGQVDELVRPTGRVRAQVLGEQHLGQRLAQRPVLAVRRDDHALAHALRAGRNGPRRALEVDEAHAAAAVRVELVVVAERRDEGAVPGGGVHEQLALGGGDALPVEGELDHGRIVLVR